MGPGKVRVQHGRVPRSMCRWAGCGRLPGSVWYTYGSNTADIDEIVDSHLKRGKVVSGCCCRRTSAAERPRDDARTRFARRSPGRPARSKCASTARRRRRAALAVVCHPHPQFGGTLDNKVVQTIARAASAGWASVPLQLSRRRRLGGRLGRRPGRSRRCARGASTPGGARGFAGLPLPAGRLLVRRLCRRRGREPAAAMARPRRIVLRRPVHRKAAGRRRTGRHVVIHGDTDDVVPLGATLAWARPQNLAGHRLAPASATSSTASSPC